MSGFVSRRAREEVQVDEDLFYVRALGASERLPVILRTRRALEVESRETGRSLEELSEAGVQVPYDADSIAEAVVSGLVGWKAANGGPEFDPNNQVKNIEMLSDGAYLAIGMKVLEISFASGETLKNSD